MVPAAVTIRCFVCTPTALQFSFMGSPQVPRRLQTRGVYALLRHPQAFGNMCFLIGALIG